MTLRDERDELLGKASVFDARLAFAMRHAKAAEDLLRQAIIERDSARALLLEARGVLGGFSFGKGLATRIDIELGKQPNAQH